MTTVRLLSCAFSVLLGLYLAVAGGNALAENLLVKGGVRYLGWKESEAQFRTCDGFVLSIGDGNIEDTRDRCTPPPPASSPVPLEFHDVYFDSGKHSIRPGDAVILQKIAESLRLTPGLRVQIVGNCDERGSSEYNIALGEKRADAVKTYLINLGVDGKLLLTVSYGKERPVYSGHDETAWAKNRRVYFSILR